MVILWVRYLKKQANSYLFIDQAGHDFILQIKSTYGTH